MRLTVNFDDEHARDTASEVGDVWANYDLASELRVFEAFGPNG
jgi:hypothetical protein